MHACVCACVCVYRCLCSWSVFLFFFFFLGMKRGIGRGGMEKRKRERFENMFTKQIQEKSLILEGEKENRAEWMSSSNSQPKLAARL